jgi:hypothetical protein
MEWDLVGLLTVWVTWGLWVGAGLGVSGWLQAAVRWVVLETGVWLLVAVIVIGGAKVWSNSMTVMPWTLINLFIDPAMLWAYV